MTEDKITYADVEEYQMLFTLAPPFLLEIFARRATDLVLKFKPIIQSYMDNLSDVQKNKLDIILNSDIDELLDKLAQYCDEFLVHGVDVEGKAAGADKELVSILTEAMMIDESIVITYAGGIGSIEDLEHFREISQGKIDFTIGSALDLFGGKLPYEEIKKIKEPKERIVFFAECLQKKIGLLQCPLKLEIKNDKCALKEN